MVLYMSNDGILINKTTKKLWFIIGTIIKSIIIVLIIGFIMFGLSGGGAELYQKNSLIYGYEYWNDYAHLNFIYGLIGIIIYIVINCFGFLLYNYITSKFKNYKIIIGKIVFILSSIFINFLMSLAYTDFNSYSFKNMMLEIFNNIIVGYGWITFPIIFLIIYLKRVKN